MAGPPEFARLGAVLRCTLLASGHLQDLRDAVGGEPGKADLGKEPSAGLQDGVHGGLRVGLPGQLSRLQVAHLSA